MKLNKVLWITYILMLAVKLIADKFCKILVLRSLADFGFLAVAIALCIYSVNSIIKQHKEEKNKKVWLTEHMTILPMSKEVVFIVNSQIEKWQEDIISKVEKAASEEGLKVTVNSPLSEVIDNYYS